MRLIDADVLLDTPKIRDLPIHLTWEIQTAPTIDAVPVVRCRECKHWFTVIDREKAEFGLCKVKKAEIETTLRSGFCHKGRRREDGGI